MRVGSKGFVLLAAVLLLSLLGLMIVNTSVLLHAELWSIGSARRSLQARYTAEAGLLDLAERFEPGLHVWEEGDLAELVALGRRTTFPGPPHGYTFLSRQVFFQDDAPPQLRVRVRADAVGGATKTLEGHFVHAAKPYAPAGLVVVMGDLEDLRTSVDVPPAAAIFVAGDGSTAPLSGGSVAAALRLHESLAAFDISLPSTGSPAVVRPIRIDRFLDDLRRVPESGGIWNLANFGNSFRVLSGGVVQDLVGEGLLVVTGSLRLEGAVDFSGVLLVEGSLELVTEHCRFRGFTQVGSLRVQQPCHFTQDVTAVLRADRLQRLPRRVRLFAMGDAIGG